jgi:putative DNA primase/helicase
MATLDQVISQMIAADMPPLPPGHPVPDGRWHRYGPKKKAWYRLFEYPGRNGKRYISGAFGYFRGADPGTFKVQSDWRGMEPAELERIKRSQAQIEADEQAKCEKRAVDAANRARAQYDAASPSGESPYLKRKGVEPDAGLRFAPDGTLLVPMVRYDVGEEQLKDPGYHGPRRLCGLQKIAPDGAKLFNKGMWKEGCACRLGPEPKEGDPILIAEGVATALSIRQAVGRSRTVYVAFDAGNLLPAARILRKLHPKSPMLFCADDDAYLEAYISKRMRDEWGAKENFETWSPAKAYPARDGELSVQTERYTDAHGVDVITGLFRLTPPEGEIRSRTFVMLNAGRTKAHAAAAELGIAAVCFPVFGARARMLHSDPDAGRLTDFNDLHAAEGLAAAEKQIAEAISALIAADGGRLELSKEIAEAAGGGRKKKKRKEEAAGGAGGRDGGGGDGDGGGEEVGRFWNRFWHLIDRFTWVYPTETAYDHELGDFVGINPMRLQFGRELTETWLTSKKRRNVDLPDVVFDPTGKARPPKLNLYRGFAIAPSKEGSCDKLIELLAFLCGDDVNVFEWVLKWLALPLQRPGGKMQTALLLRGKEGAGKNLFFGAIRDIYGQHGGVITQRELEDRFNLWLSAKLFLIANEVVTRQEMGHHRGFIKHLITEPEIWINRKMKDARCEANHVNVVFFSNEDQPLQLGPDDRRMVVIDTPPKRDKVFYREILAEIRKGGAAALHQYLLNVQLVDFDESAEPIETEAKRRLIEISMNAAQLFWKDIHDGEIALPYCPALVEHVYRAYAIWCRRNGEKMPARINRFIPAFMTLNGVRRVEPRVPVLSRQDGIWYASQDKTARRRVLLMGERPEGLSDFAWVDEGVLKFAKAMEVYCRGEEETAIW